MSNEQFDFTTEGWSPVEVEASTSDGMTFDWSPEVRLPYRAIGLRICTPRKVMLASATIGGGMNLFQPITVSGAIPIQDAKRTSSPRTALLDTNHRTIDLEPGDWIVEPFFQHPLVLKPNAITVKFDRDLVRDHPALQREAPRVFVRLLVPDEIKET